MTAEYTFAERLRQLIEIKQTNQAELAKVAGISKSNISRYLSGGYKAKQDVLFKIATYYNVAEAWLMGFDVPMDRIKNTTPTVDAERQRLIEMVMQLEPEQVRSLIALLRK